MKQEDKFAIFVGIASAIMLMLCIMFGCKPQQQFGSHTKDSVRVEQRIDTFLLMSHDSVIVQMPCSDSIEVAYVDRWHTNTIYKRTISHDTINTYRLDSVPYPVEVEKVVIRNSRIATFALWYMWISLVAIVAAIALYIYRKFFLP